MEEFQMFYDIERSRGGVVTWSDGFRSLLTNFKWFYSVQEINLDLFSFF